MLAVEDLHARYGDSPVLRGISLSLQSGVSMGLLGRNGMGKTTLIRTLMGYVPATGGRVRWNGRDVTGEPPERMARLGIGYVPEGRGIFPNLSVRENLVMTARAARDDASPWTLERVLHTFPQLKERLSHGGQQLSGGEQQMLAIGRALMTQPRLLILDEATEGLAPLVVAEIWRVVAEIRASGISTLIVDRNYRAVLAHTDRAIVLEKGSVAVAGASKALALESAALARWLGV
jgi:branched-chain amino acid transport system ATP-binding protein